MLSRDEDMDLEVKDNVAWFPRVDVRQQVSENRVTKIRIALIACNVTALNCDSQPIKRKPAENVPSGSDKESRGFMLRFNLPGTFITLDDT